MTHEHPSNASVSLFFEHFRQNLEKIRDGLPTANPTQRAHIMLGQLREFEKSVSEIQDNLPQDQSEAISLAVLRRINDFRGFVQWLISEQTIAPVSSLFYRNRQRAWERLHGESDLPETERFEWLIEGSLGYRESEGAKTFFVFAYSELRLIITFPSDRVRIEDKAQDLLWFVARVLPVYLGGAINRPLTRPETDSNVIARDSRFLNLLAMVEKAAVTDVSIMLEGESGTGKEVIANFIHQRSPRHRKALIAVNCAAIPAGLIESELFGHEKGAFTGAYARQVGRIEEADGGTLFLDEIGEMELPMQSKLLRFLQLHEFHRVGGKQKVTVDVRIVAATNRNLRQQVADGQFREDLYYRLSVMPFQVPPLRERPFDVAPLTQFFLHKYAKSFGLSIPEIDPMVLQLLASHDFPGNVRELENLVQNMLVTSQGEMIRPEHLPDTIRGLEPKGQVVPQHPSRRQRFRLTRHTAKTFKLPLRKGRQVVNASPWQNQVPQTNRELKELKALIQNYAAELTCDLERRFLEHLLERAGGSMPQAAKLAGINRTLLYKMLERTKQG